MDSKTKKLNLALLLFIITQFGSALFIQAANNDLLVTDKITSRLPNFLLGSYEGTLINGSKVTTDAICTITAGRGDRYILSFDNKSLQNSSVRFTKDDDVYTSTVIIQGKNSFITLDEDGDLSISSNQSSRNRITFNGELIDSGVNDEYVNQQVITNGNVHVQNGNQQISTSNGNNDVYIRNGNQTIHTNEDHTVINNSSTNTRRNPKRRRSNRAIRVNNGNVSVSTNGQGVSINGGVSINNNSNQDIEVYNEDHYDPYGGVGYCPGASSCVVNSCQHINTNYNYYNCDDNEVVELPRSVLGFYRGRLEAYEINNRKGISRVVRTGCKTYRIEFSDQIPPIHGVQFGRKNNFDEYTSVIVQGQYSAAIEIDTSFDNLDIDGDILTINFKGDKE